MVDHVKMHAHVGETPPPPPPRIPGLGRPEIRYGTSGKSKRSLFSVIARRLFR